MPLCCERQTSSKPKVSMASNECFLEIINFKCFYTFTGLLFSIGEKLTVSQRRRPIRFNNCSICKFQVLLHNFFKVHFNYNFDKERFSCITITFVSNTGYASICWYLSKYFLVDSLQK